MLTGAVQDLDTTLRLDTSLAVGYSARGSIHLDRGNFDVAIQDFDKALTLGPASADTHNYRGSAYWRKGDSERALQDYSRALDLRPNKNAFANRGNLLLQRGEWEKARNDLLRARNMGMDIVDAFRVAHGGVSAFEEEHNLKLPQDIADMVSLDEAPQEVHTGESILGMFERLRKSIPQEAWNNLPTDGAKNYKHYLYGHPKVED